MVVEDRHSDQEHPLEGVADGVGDRVHDVKAAKCYLVCAEKDR